MKKLLLILSIIIVPLALMAMIYFMHWSTGGKTEQVDIPLYCNMNSIKELNDAITPIAKKWRLNATLVNFNALFNGINEINDMNGEITLEYFSRNNRNFGNAGKVIRVSIDMKTSRIYKIEYYPIIEEKRIPETISINNWELTVDEAMKVIISESISNEISGLTDPYLGISIRINNWNIKLFKSLYEMQNLDRLGLHYKDLIIEEIEINPINKDVILVE